MFGAYHNDVLIAYAPEKGRLDHFKELGYRIRQVPVKDIGKIAQNEHRLKQVLITAERVINKCDQ